jgi:hypothetical protein
MASSNFNMEDPAKQEAIRRGSHEYIPTAGKHGIYVVKPYQHQEYPKMVASSLKDAKGNPKHPKPEFKSFLTSKGVAIPQDLAVQNYQTALTEWDLFMQSSIVNSKAEESAWLKANG